MVKLCFSIPKIKSKTSINKTRETYLQDQRLTRRMCWKSRKRVVQSEQIFARMCAYVDGVEEYNE